MSSSLETVLWILNSSLIFARALAKFGSSPWKSFLRVECSCLKIANTYMSKKYFNLIICADFFFRKLLAYFSSVFRHSEICLQFHHLKSFLVVVRNGFTFGLRCFHNINSVKVRHVKLCVYYIYVFNLCPYRKSGEFKIDSTYIKWAKFRLKMNFIT